MNHMISMSSPYKESAFVQIAATAHQKGLLADCWVPLDPGNIGLFQRHPRLASSAVRRAYGIPTSPVAPATSLMTHSLLRFGRWPSELMALQGARLDRAVSRRIAQSSSGTHVGMPYASKSTFEACSARGIRTVFNHVNADFDVENDAFYQEALRAKTKQERDDILREQWPAQIVARVDEEVAMADTVLVPAEMVARDLVAKGIPREKILTIHYGVDSDQFPYFDRSERKRDYVNVLYVGHVGYRKGLRYLADAVAQASDSAQIRLQVLGPVVSRSGLLSRLDPTITYLGTSAVGGVLAAYQDADIFVLPSLADSFGRVVLEAMATGLPVIVSDRTGAHEAIDNGRDGFVVPARDVDGLASRLRQLATDQDLRIRMGSAARITAEQYSWDRFSDSFFEWNVY